MGKVTPSLAVWTTHPLARGGTDLMTSSTSDRELPLGSLGSSRGMTNQAAFEALGSFRSIADHEVEGAGRNFAEPCIAVE